MPLIGLFNAAQASSHAAGHRVLQRHFAFDAVCFGVSGHRYHHRLRAAGIYHVKLLPLQDAVHRNVSFLSSASVFCGGEHFSIGGKLLKLKQVV